MKKSHKQICMHEKLMEDFPNALGCFEWYRRKIEYS